MLVCTLMMNLQNTLLLPKIILPEIDVSYVFGHLLSQNHLLDMGFNVWDPWAHDLAACILSEVWCEFTCRYFQTFENFVDQNETQYNYDVPFGVILSDAWSFFTLTSSVYIDTAPLESIYINLGVTINFSYCHTEKSQSK